MTASQLENLTFAEAKALIKAIQKQAAKNVSQLDKEGEKLEELSVELEEQGQDKEAKAAMKQAEKCDREAHKWAELECLI